MVNHGERRSGRGIGPLARVAAQDEREEAALRAAEATSGIKSLLQAGQQVGDLIRMDFGEAHVLVHDALREMVGGVPHGCLLLATRSRPDTDAGNGAEPMASGEPPTLLLLRALGSSSLPNDIEMQQARMLAGQRASDSPHNWDEEHNTDQFTLNQMRYAGLRCSILGTFRMSVTDTANGERNLTFGNDIDNFYAGQGMKIYKPIGAALERIANFTREADPDPFRVRVGEIKYAATLEGDRPESVPVTMTPHDIVAQRTALFGMTRTGKSNTVKTIARSVFELRLDASDSLRVAQLIIDPNGEYANDNPQDDGCLRNAGLLPGANADDVVTYGLTPHPNDPGRRITKVNFFGPALTQQSPSTKRELDDALASLYMGKQILDGRLAEEGAGYIGAFRSTSMEAPPGITDYGEYTRYRRAVFVYQSILFGAGFSQPRNDVSVQGLFSKEILAAMEASSLFGFTEQVAAGSMSWNAATDFCRKLGEWIKSNTGQDFDRDYQRKNDGRNWSDDRLLGLLRIFEYSRGLQALRECREWHDPSRDKDYTEEIVDDIAEGRLVILDQALGDPDMNEQSAERIMRSIFERQQRLFTNPRKGDNGEFLPPDPVIVYVEEAHTLLPRGSEEDTSNIWARTAKEGAKFNIGLVYSTQEPSSIQRNILRNTENWFIAHLNNTDETRELDKYNDFREMTDSIRQVKETGFLKVRMLSSPYTLPVQIDRFTAPTPGD